MKINDVSDLLDLSVVAVLFFGYCIGSIPSGYLFARWHGIDDIRVHGSGGTGATNVARKLGLISFFIVFFADFIKSYLYIVCLLYYNFSQALVLGAAIALLIGNSFSLFLGFRGGKGVATTFGLLYALYPHYLFILFFEWLSVFLVSQTVGIASVVLFLSMPVCSYFFTDMTILFFPFTFFISIWGLLTHRDNIRLYARTFL